MTKYDKIPEELKAFNNWVLFKSTPKTDKKGVVKYTKIPYQVNGKKASTNKPDTWNSFDAVKAVAVKFSGIGFVFNNSPFVGIDIDHCIKDGKLSDTAKDIIRALGSYAEVSPSGEGVHIIAKGNIEIKTNKNTSLGLEIYNTGRYFTVTGKPINKYSKITENNTALKAVYEKYFAGKTDKKPPQKEMNTLPVMAAAVDDEVLIKKICSSQQGEKFKKLFYQGDTSNNKDDNSSADLALCNILAFWTCKNHEQINRIFKASALYRPEKWNKIHFSNGDTYGKRTIKTAILGCSNVYNAGGQSDPVNDFEEVDENGQPVFKYPYLTGKGTPRLNAWQNTEYLFNRLHITVRYNILRKSIEVFGCEDLKTTNFDNIVTYLLSICSQHNLNVSANTLANNLAFIADKNRYSPVCEYIFECISTWDGHSRIKDLFDCLELETGQDEEFCFLLFKKWLLSCVAMAFNEGEDASHGVLILCGGQGIGKTRFLYDILPQCGKSWGADGLALNPTNKDDVLRVAMYWIVELGEINDTIKAERLERLKAFITAKKDILRKPYARGTVEMPRTTALYGTVNTKEFLRDSTGERRYWVIAVTDIHSEKIQQIDINQLWGELGYLARIEGAPHWLTKEEIVKLNAQNENYKNLTEAERTIIDCLDWGVDPQKWKYRTASELCTEITLEYNNRRSSNNHLARAIRSLKNSHMLGGKEEYIKLPTNNHSKVYYLPPIKLRHDVDTDFGKIIADDLY